MTLYDRFRLSSLDTAGIGLDTQPEAEVLEHELLPLGAQVIGYSPEPEAVFCFLQGFGDTVFAVELFASGQWAYPVAGSFSHFLGLVLACRGTAVIPMGWRWSRRRFEAAVEDLRPSPRQMSILRALRNAYSPVSIPDPYQYLQAVRQGFDGSGLRFSPELEKSGIVFPSCQEAAVGFLSGFDGRGKGAGKAVPVGKAFSWGGRSWRLETVYLCKEGLVADLRIELPPEEIIAYRQTEEQQDAPQQNPFDVRAGVSLAVNGRPLAEKRGYRKCWNPWSDNDFSAWRLTQRFQCDRERGWVFLRNSYRWNGKHVPALQTLRLTLQALPVYEPGEQFTVSAPGQQVTLRNPLTGQSHVLTVEEYGQQVMEFDLLTEYPCQYRRMVYTLTPDLPDDAFRLQDCARKAALRPNAGAGAIGVIENELPASLGIIGGADGPTAYFVTDKAEAGRHVALSSLQYTQPETVTWRIGFKKKPYDDFTMEIEMQG